MDQSWVFLPRSYPPQAPTTSKTKQSIMATTTLSLCLVPSTSAVTCSSLSSATRRSSSVSYYLDSPSRRLPVSRFDSTRFIDDNIAPPELQFSTSKDTVYSQVSYGSEYYSEYEDFSDNFSFSGFENKEDYRVPKGYFGHEKNKKVAADERQGRRHHSIDYSAFHSWRHQRSLRDHWIDSQRNNTLTRQSAERHLALVTEARPELEQLESATEAREAQLAKPSKLRNLFTNIKKNNRRKKNVTQGSF